MRGKSTKRSKKHYIMGFVAGRVGLIIHLKALEGGLVEQTWAKLL